MIQAVPCILFAYEGYLVVGNIAGEMDNPNKQVPIAVVVGVAIVSLLYLGITIGCVTAGTGNVYELM
ncbi:MAG: amino acid permease [Mycoplasmoidaceae bacterium]|nr:amino acid permease [Mycoplasmoidaceae bacterium]